MELKKAIVFGLVVGFVVGLILAFNPVGANPLKEKNSFKPVETTMTWDKAIEQNETVLVEKTSPNARPTPEELEKVYREYQEVAP